MCVNLTHQRWCFSQLSSDDRPNRPRPIPFELQTQIIQSIKTDASTHEGYETLKTLCLVSPAWKVGLASSRPPAILHAEADHLLNNGAQSEAQQILLHSVRLSSPRSTRFKKFYSCLSTYPHLGELVKRFDAGATRIAGRQFLQHVHLMPALEHVERAYWGPEESMAAQTDRRRPAPTSLWIFRSADDPSMSGERPAWARLSAFFDLHSLGRFDFSGSALNILVESLLPDIPQQVTSFAIRDFVMDDAVGLLESLGTRREITSLDLLPRKASIRGLPVLRSTVSPLVFLPNLRRLAICDRSLDGLLDTPHKLLETLIIGIPPGDLYEAPEDGSEGSDFDGDNSASSDDGDSAATSSEDDDFDDFENDGAGPVVAQHEIVPALEPADVYDFGANRGERPSLQAEDQDEGIETRTQRAGFPDAHPLHEMVDEICRIRLGRSGLVPGAQATRPSGRVHEDALVPDGRSAGATWCPGDGREAPRRRHRTARLAGATLATRVVCGGVHRAGVSFLMYSKPFLTAGRLSLSCLARQ